MLTAIRRWFAREPRQELIDSLGEASLPSMQQSIIEILRALRSPTSTPTAIGNAVSQDPGIALHVLRIVNSPAFGLRRQVDNIGHAVTLIGRAEMEALVLGVAVKRTLPSGHPAARSFWSVGAQRAVTARALAAEIQPASASLCFTAGLLQDLAVPLLLEAKPEYAELLQSTSHANLGEVERSQFGWTHADVAGWLCDAWGFPAPLRSAIAGHHGDDDAPVPVQVVALVDGSTQADELIETVHREFGVRPDLIRTALSLGETQGAELAAVLG